MDVARNHHPPASDACLCAPLRVPASAAVPASVAPPPLLPLAYTQVSVVPRVFSHHGFLCASVPLSLPHCVCATSRNLLFLVIFFRCPFRVRARCQGASTPWQFPAPAPAPLLLGHSGTIIITPPPPTPPCCIYPIPSDKFCGVWR